MNKIERYVVTVVDNGESCDGRARVLGCFKTEDEAKAYVRNDMENVRNYMAGCIENCDFDEMTIISENDDARCWNIEKVEIEL